MGKGDRRTTKGKRYISSYGNKRSRGDMPVVAQHAATAPKTGPKAATRKTAARKKA